MSEQRQSVKANNSLVWKLAFAQVRRVLAVCLRIDFWLIVLGVISLIYYGEWQGQIAAQHSAMIIEDIEESPSQLLVDGGVYYSLASESSGLRVTVLEPSGLFPENSHRNITYETRPQGATPLSYPPEQIDRFSGKGVFYQYYLPLAEGGFLLIQTDFSHILSVMMIGLIALLLIQAIIILSSIWKAQRNTTRVLQPLFDLTDAAQTMSSGGDLSVPLSSAIDALDTITENHLDRRISIADERAELQGLASAINNMLDRLDASYQAQLRFVSDASHELRTPIAIIQGYAGLLERWGKDDPDTLNEAIQAIKSESVGMQLLVEQLLFLARSDNQSIAIKKQRVDLSGLLEEVVKETEMINDTHVLQGNIAPDLWVEGDPQLLKQSVRILVDNSIKYTPEKGVITIQGEGEKGQIKISVTDTGIGMNEEEVAHVFERFWRADEARNRKTGGTGLGLSIAKWIVDSHQGYLELSSRKGLGTKTSILLPRASTPISIQTEEIA